MRGTFSLLNEDLCLTRSTIELYIRISYFGDSLITEMESPESIRKSFYARDETGDDYIYQFRELSMEQLQSGGWDSCVFPPTPKERERLICNCKEFERLKQLLGGNAELLAMLSGAGMPGEDDDDDEEGGKGLGMGGAGGMADLDKDKAKKKPSDAQKGHGKNPLQEYLEAEAEHWKLLMEMLALARNAPKGLSPSVGTRKGGPCVSVMPCQPCPPCLPCLPCPPCKPCQPCYITSCSPCG